MITIDDYDLPITVAQKLICGLRPGTEFQNQMCKMLTGKISEGQDMFDDDEIREIADYLYLYCDKAEFQQILKARKPIVMPASERSILNWIERLKDKGLINDGTCVNELISMVEEGDAE